MGRAMFKRTFARTITDNLRAPHVKMWGFEAKRARKFTRTSLRTLPCNLFPMLSARLIQNFGAGGILRGCSGSGHLESLQQAGAFLTPKAFHLRKIPAPIKIKSAPRPLPEKTQNTPPPLKRGILWTWRFSCRKNAIFPGAHKFGSAISGPRIADTEFYGHEAFSDHRK